MFRFFGAHPATYMWRRPLLTMPNTVIGIRGDPKNAVAQGKSTDKQRPKGADTEER